MGAKHLVHVFQLWMCDRSVEYGIGRVIFVIIKGLFVEGGANSKIYYVLKSKEISAYFVATVRIFESVVIESLRVQPFTNQVNCH